MNDKEKDSIKHNKEVIFEEKPAKVDSEHPQNAESENGNQVNHLIEVKGGTYRIINGVKLKMMSISMREEGLTDEEQDKRASIHLPDQGIINIVEEMKIHLDEETDLIVKEIQPYTMETRGHVIFEIISKGVKQNN